jgi:hypothetical protein
MPRSGSRSIVRHGPRATSPRSPARPRAHAQRSVHPAPSAEGVRADQFRTHRSCRQRGVGLPKTARARTPQRRPLIARGHGRGRSRGAGRRSQLPRALRPLRRRPHVACGRGTCKPARRSPRAAEKGKADRRRPPRPRGSSSDVHPAPARLEQRADGPGNGLPIHPVKRLRERGNPENAEIARQRFGGHHFPSRIPNPTQSRLPGGLGNHAGIAIDPNHLFEERGEQQRERAWATADVEQTSRPVESQLNAKHVGHRRRIGKTPPRVVRSASAVQRPIRPAARGHGQNVDNARVRERALARQDVVV